MPRPDPDIIVQTASAAGVALAGEAVDRLVDFANLLRTLGVDLGLVARADADRIVERHVSDSMRAAGVVADGDRTAADLGSGGGLPGIPVAIARPDVTVFLLESRARRVAFLELACERLGVGNGTPVRTRVEDADVRALDLCFARALAPLPRAWSLALPLLRPGGRLVYFAGQHADVAAAESLDAAAVHVVRAPSVASGGPLVIIGRL